MACLGIQEAFAMYGAKLHNVQWSVSAWAPDGSLVVSLWAHHYRKGPSGTAEYADRLDRWGGPGNREFRENVARAFAEGSAVRLVVTSTLETDHVEFGRDASKIRKDFDPKQGLIGEVVDLNGGRCVFRFRRATTS